MMSSRMFCGSPPYMTRLTSPFCDSFCFFAPAVVFASRQCCTMRREPAMMGLGELLYLEASRLKWSDRSFQKPDVHSCTFTQSSYSHHPQDMLIILILSSSYYASLLHGDGVTLLSSLHDMRPCVIQPLSSPM